MKKGKNKIISITESKACVIGVIISLISSIIASFISANMFVDILNESSKVENSVSVLTLAGLLIPILFIVFGMVILGFIVICSTQNKK